MKHLAVTPLTRYECDGPTMLLFEQGPPLEVPAGLYFTCGVGAVIDLNKMTQIKHPPRTNA